VTLTTETTNRATPEPTSLDIALACIARGWPVFPVTQDKRPLVRWSSESTLDTELARRWWTTAFPGAKVGVPTGQRSGLYVLDEDAPGAATELVEGTGAPFVLTQSGNRHYLFSAPANGKPVRNSVRKIAGDGVPVDVRGDGGMVVMWHMPPEGELSSLPENIAEKAGSPVGVVEMTTYTGPGDADWGRRKLVEACENVRHAVESTRNLTLFVNGCRVWEAINGGHLDAGDAMQALGEAALAAGLTEAETFGTLRSARDSSEGHSDGPLDRFRTVQEMPPAPTLSVVPDSPSASVADEWEQAWSDRQQLEQEYLWELSSYDPLRADQLTSIYRGEVEPVVPTMFEREDGVQLIYPGKVHSFVGGSESCKTWAAKVAAVTEMHKGNSVMYFDLEDNEVTAVERLKLLGATEDEVRDLFLYISPEERFDALAEAHIRHWDARRSIQDLPTPPVTLAIIDSVAEVLGLDDGNPNDSKDIVRLHRGLPRTLTSMGAAVILIDHDTKAGEDSRFASGSERKLSGIDGAQFKFKVKDTFSEGHTGLVRIKAGKDRAGKVRKFCLDQKPLSPIADLKLVSTKQPDGTYRVTYELKVPTAPTVRDSVLEHVEQVQSIQSRVVEVLTEAPGLTKGVLRQRVGGRAAGVGDAIDEMVSNGTVRIEEGARGAQLHFLTRRP
jgi:hypothetical protein